MTASHCTTPAVHKKAQFVVNTNFSIIFFLVCFCLCHVNSDSLLSFEHSLILSCIG